MEGNKTRKAPRQIMLDWMMTDGNL